MMRPPWGVRLAAAAVALAALAAGPAAAQSLAVTQAVTTLNLPPYSFTGGVIGTRDAGVDAHQTDMLSEFQRQLTYGTLIVPPKITVPPAAAPDRCEAPPPTRGRAKPPAVPNCVPAPASRDVTESDLDALQAAPPQ